MMLAWEGLPYLPTPNRTFLFKCARWSMTARSGGSSAPTTLLPRPRVRAARTQTRRSNISCGSMRPSRSSGSVPPVEAASRTSGGLRQPRLPCRWGIGYCRIWACWCARFPRWRSSCRGSNPVARHAPWRRHWSTRGGKPCRRVPDRLRLWKGGLRDLVREAVPGTPSGDASHPGHGWVPREKRPCAHPARPWHRGGSSHRVGGWGS